ncbi:replication-relaxation family protein [Streptomyces sp. NPDC060028]|uniref:replication-relaxation family protein n=1 Tax=Streptomyces sp. NPDC060028 TaxID=3347041 RepID=UPI003674DB55
MAQVITEEESDGRSYVRRVMVELAELGLVETNGKDGKDQIWNLTPAGQKALADGNGLPPRPKAGTGAKAVRAGFGPHAVAVTDTILAYTDTVLGSREYLTDWQVEVNHAIKETGLSFNTDAVLAVPTRTSEVRFFELDNGSMYQAWPSGLRGAAAERSAAGVVRHGMAYAGPGEGCVCKRHDCGGVVPVSWCPEHGDAVGPVMEWHPGGGIRCAALAGQRTELPVSR